MKHEYGIKVRQHAVKSKQHIAYDRQDTKRNNGAHAKASEHRKRGCVSHTINLGHQPWGSIGQAARRFLPLERLLPREHLHTARVLMI